MARPIPSLWIAMGVSAVVVCLLLAILLPVLLTDSSTAEHSTAPKVLETVPVIDGHNDLAWNLRSLAKNQLKNFNFTANLTEDPVWGMHVCSSCFTDLPRLRAGRVGAQFWAAYVSCNSQYKDAVQQTLEQIDIIKRLVQAYPDDLVFVTTAQGILDAFASKKIGSLIGVEGGHSIDSSLATLRLMYEMGTRYLTLTHSCNTPWADSSPMDEPGREPEHGGLTEFGRTVVREMNRLGMMVDLSHVSKGTMLTALEISRAPVIFSHSSAYSICNHTRNVQDEVLKMVTDNNGVVMVNFYTAFVACGGNATLDDVVAHINHIRDVAGVDHVGIGADYDGVSSVPEGLEDVSKYPALFEKLAEDPAWTEEDLQKLAGLNLIRVFKEVEDVRDRMAAEGFTPIDDLLSVSDLGNNTQCNSDVKSVDEFKATTIAPQG